MTPQEAADILVVRCDVFNEQYGNKLPRVAARGVKVVMAALFDLLKAVGYEHHVVLVLQYEIARGGLRKISPDQELLAYGQVFYDRDSKNFWWRTISLPIETPFGIGYLTIPGVRVVELDDLVELGISVQEIIEQIRNEAAKVGIAELQKLATQKPAMA